MPPERGGEPVVTSVPEKPTHCRDCGQPFESVAMASLMPAKLAKQRGEFTTRWRQQCDGCDDAAPNAWAKRQADLVEVRRLDEWARSVPKEYRHNDVERFAKRAGAEAWEAIQQWRPWREDGTSCGLAVLGETGRCKTRMVFEKLKRLLVEEGITFGYLNGARFADLVRGQFTKKEVREELAEVFRHRVVFLDDLGKAKLSDFVEEAFYARIEECHSREVPIVFTSNMTLGEIAQSFVTEDRCLPIMRRLQACETVVIDEEGGAA